MFAGSRFCARCGAEATRDVLEDETPLPCPRCKEPLQALKLGATSARECSACGGLWVDPQALQKLCDVREEHAGVVSALAARVPTNTAPPDTVHYVPCPRCRKLMNRVNFSKSSGVIMDVCKTDGVWLDRGELQRVVGFVEAGGLTVARERERERLVDEQRRITALEARRAAVSADVNVYTTSSWKSDSSPNTPMEQLLRDALGMFVRHEK
jgi:Zn-finger nucleic acid-binding protein